MRRGFCVSLEIKPEFCIIGGIPAVFSSFHDANASNRKFTKRLRFPDCFSFFYEV